MQELKETQKKILEAGKREFLEKGFKDASLRNIVKEAGFTQGAFYGYYPDKESLFNELVSDAADGLMKIYKDHQDCYFDLIPTFRTSESQQISRDFTKVFVDYIYDHYDAFNLLIYKSKGTKYENFIYDLIRMDVARTEEFFGELMRSGRLEGSVSHELHHMITSAFFIGVFETVAHGMSKEQACQYVGELSNFFLHGWESLLKLK